MVNQSISNINKQNLKIISGSNSVVNRDDETEVLLLNLNSKSDMVSKNFGKPSVELESSTSADSDEKASTVGDATPRTSGVQSPSRGGESDQRNRRSTSVMGTNLANIRRAEGVNDTVYEEKVHPSYNSDHSSRAMFILHEKELDMKVGFNDEERLHREFNSSNRSTLDSRTSSSLKKVSNSASDKESNSETDTSSSLNSESEREREERRERRREILAEKAALYMI
ncbi:hypothetical protein OROGR_031146 [Orobanche gracilis]